MKKLVLSLLFLSALALPAFAASGGDPLTLNKPVDAGKPGEPPKKKGGADDMSGGRFAGDPIYIHLAPMVLPVITDSGVEQLVTLVIDVQVKNFDAADDMHTNMPRVMDSLMRALYGGLGQGTLRNGKLIDPNKVKAKATAAVGEVIGVDNITDILIQSVSQRML
ncbi:MAG: hypothetical protein P4M15_00420 [Alphaproteobacteria bacterium]|nr:hypothetical protein [Alphaproteobacteria bacterium]